MYIYICQYTYIYIYINIYVFVFSYSYIYIYIYIYIRPAGLEMGRVKTAFSCDWQEVNHAFRSVFSCFYVVHEGQFYCDFEFSLGFTVYS